MDRISQVRALQVCVEGYPRLQHLPIDKMPGLKSLALDGFNFHDDPACFAMFSDLEEVLFVNCAGIHDLRGFRGEACRATTLYLMQCPELNSLDGIECLTQIAILEVSSPKVSDVSALRYCKALKSLSIRGADCLEDVSALSHLENVTTMCLLDCQNIRTLYGLFALQKLALLDVSGCRSISMLQLAILAGVNPSLCIVPPCNRRGWWITTFASDGFIVVARVCLGGVFVAYRAVKRIIERYVRS